MADGDADSASPWPASILLARQTYIAASRNETTATAKARSTTGNHTVEVTFWIADPPAVSFCTCHCSKVAALKVPPEVVGAQGRFVLLRAVFASGYYYSKDDEEEYFVYTGDLRSPSLESMPLPEDDDGGLRRVGEFGIVPRPRGADAGGHYLLVALRSAANSLKEYRLHVYSSEDRTWRSKEVANPCPREYAIWPDKVITVGDGVLAWVSLQQGMVVCDVLQEEEPLHARYIPLPAPLPENRQDTYLKQFRDVACCVDGTIKFVEMEQRVIVTEIREEEPPLDPRDKDVLYGSDLIKLSKSKGVEKKPKILRTVDGWSAMTWTRELGSDCWRKGSIVDVDDISVDDTALRSGQGIDESTRIMPSRNLYSAWPTLCGDGNAILYLELSRHLTDSSRWVIAVDLAKKTLKVEAPGEHPFGGCPPWQQICHPCALANHLKMTPRIKVSAIQITQKGSSANEPNNTPIRAIC
ncbi:uncharacterized protein LOC119316103 [Triticum dicoccoides]|uniref:uncharacterized protein LOC119316103 n=1 Tax=Triticum dicoccoides TaxID=85692 RepID=UPI001891E07C|nr:uncharacterized protein LOC119316103 [Triticum dicoccoides]